MWRPFASDLVSTTYEGFRKKYDKVWNAKPIQSSEGSERFDQKQLFPYKLAIEELEKRKEELSLLQSRVTIQRKDIKQKDLAFENSKTLKVQKQKKEDELWKNERKKNVLKIRSMASNKISRHRSAESQEDYHTFILTSVEKAVVISKNGSFNSRLNITVQKSNTKWQ